MEMPGQGLSTFVLEFSTVQHGTDDEVDAMISAMHDQSIDLGDFRSKMMSLLSWWCFTRLGAKRIIYIVILQYRREFVAGGGSN